MLERLDNFNLKHFRVCQQTSLSFFFLFVYYYFNIFSVISIGKQLKKIVQESSSSWLVTKDLILSCQFHVSLYFTEVSPDLHRTWEQANETQNLVRYDVATGF